ncbi:adenylyltransferase/cytidyltransferase family protein [Candidatus Uhrbacteria bacterium]|nr:adenylyltransferase/cytidyltransferase family protein [Candidatus Uhrbacteria bacterium]
MAEKDAKILLTYSELWKWISEHEDIVLTHGVFDLFHEGHRRYIEFAASCGTHLIVSVDSDSTTKMRKGALRPIRHITERMHDVLSLDCVNAVTEHAYHKELLSFVRPVHYVISLSSSTDYALEKAFVESYGGRVYLKEQMSDIHTTELIQKMMAK